MVTRRAIVIIAAIAVMFFLISIEATKRKEPAPQASDPELYSADDQDTLQD